MRKLSHENIVSLYDIFAEKDKVFLVTGGTDGLGRETVRQLAKTGAKVFFTARDEAKGERVKKAILDEGDPELKDVHLELLKMDNRSLQSVKAAAEDFLKRSQQLHVVVNNAGTFLYPFIIMSVRFEC